MKTYSELIEYKDFKSRFEYLCLDGVVGSTTFGSKRYLNQRFYSSPEWRQFRRDILVRDECCDLGIADRPIYTKMIIHHINPVTESDIFNRSSRLFDPENVITVSFQTHQAIHYGSSSLLVPDVVMERRPNDTCPWKSK